MSDLTLVTPTFKASIDSAFGQALVSGGASSEITIPQAESCTIEMWCTKGELEPGEIQVLFILNPEILWFGNRDDGLGRWSTKGAVGSFGLNTASGTRYHLAIVLTGLKAKMYLNGSFLTERDYDSAGELAATLQLKDSVSVGGKAYSTTDEIDFVAIWNGAKYTSDFTPTTTAYTGSESDLLYLYNLDGDGSNSAGESAPVDPDPVDPDPVDPDPVDPDPVDPSLPEGAIIYNDDKIIYSPYTWTGARTGMQTINAGAYFKFLMSGNEATLYFDTDGLLGDKPELLIMFDGVVSDRVILSSTVTITAPSYIQTNKHVVQVFVDAIADTSTNRWTPDTFVNLKGLVLSGNGLLHDLNPLRYKLLFFGDSITEGAYALSYRSDIAGKSALGCYPLTVGKLLNAEVGSVGFGGTGLSKGNGGVPSFGSAYGFLWGEQARDFSENPDLCVWLIGENDGIKDIVPAGLRAINAMLQLMPNTKFLLLRTLSGDQAANMQTIAETCDDTSRVFYRDTEGFFDPANASDGQHPYAYEHITSIAQGISGLARELLTSGGYTGSISSVVVEAKGIPDGVHKTTLNLNGECVFYADLTYTNNVATATGVNCAVGNKLTGSVFDDLGEHVRCAGLTATTV